MHGSDWPIMVGVTRSGEPTNPHSAASLAPVFEGRLNAEPGLSRQDVLRAITSNTAYQLHKESAVGSIEVGKRADLIVLERNFLTVPEEELGRNRLLMTMVGGRVVMGREALATALPAAQRAVNDRARVLSLRGSTGHTIPLDARGAPHGDGHRH